MVEIKLVLTEKYDFEDRDKSVKKHKLQFLELSWFRSKKPTEDFLIEFFSLGDDWDPNEGNQTGF